MTAEQCPGAGGCASDRSVPCGAGCPRHRHLRHDHYQPPPGILACASRTSIPHGHSLDNAALGLGSGCLGGVGGGHP